MKYPVAEQGPDTLGTGRCASAHYYRIVRPAPQECLDQGSRGQCFPHRNGMYPDRWARQFRPGPKQSKAFCQALPIAAGALYPAFDLLLSPMIASAAMSLSSVSVISNALRLRRVQL